MTAKTWMAVLMPLLTLGAVVTKAADDPDKIAFFEKNVRPVLVNHCYTCHSADTQPHGELRVDDRAGLIAGGNSGPAVVPGHPEQSVIIQRLTTKDQRRHMPREGTPLTENEIADISKWIADGAAWPTEAFPARYGHPAQYYENLKARHWAWQPLKNTDPPQLRDDGWAETTVDRFVFAKLSEHKLQPVADADRLTLIRRVTFDLTGLPPTPAEVRAFLKYKSPKAFERVVDRLLASPRFGERWGRHWLDIARYGESTGPSRNVPYPYAWRYRDYVIDALNRDVPFDQFIREQIAGDLLPAASPLERNRLLIATGYLALGPKDVNQRFKERFLMDNVDEKIDTVSRSVLAVTVACARCHDHKFDPIPTADYYALAGVFRSTQDASGLGSKMGGDGYDYYDPKLLLTLATYKPSPADDKVKKLREQEAAAQHAWEDLTDTPEALIAGPDGKPREDALRKKYQDLLTELLATEDPGTLGYGVHGVREGPIGDTSIRIRGEAERVGPVVPRGFLTAFDVPGAKSVDRAHSGRLELAEWLTSPKNPLTPRVAVNRIWQHLFGQGIVSTVDNFGFMGDRPSNPELLDYLANQFIEHGWSTKYMVRTLVLTHAYRLGADVPGGYRDVDPANKYVWRHSPRRLDAEEIRDSMLLSSGALRYGAPGAAVERLHMIEIQDNGPEAAQMRTIANASLYRSVYLPLLRGITPDSLDAFDAVTQTLVTGERDNTTVPSQALFLLNSSFVRKQSLAFADGVLADRTAETARIQAVYEWTLSRRPTAREVNRAAAFLRIYEEGATQARAAQQQPAERDARVVQVTAANAKADAAINDDAAHGAAAAFAEVIRPESAREEAWMSFIQSLYASAEFRFVR